MTSDDGPRSTLGSGPLTEGKSITAEEHRAPSTGVARNGSEWFYKRLSSRKYRVPIFLSYSTPTTPDQFAMAEGVYRCLARRDLAPRTLGVNEYDFKAPLEAIRRIMGDSQGLLAIAFKKTNVEKGRTKRRHGREEPRDEVLKGRSFASPWVQIEAAMAYQWRLPILILREKGVVADGLLEPGVVSWYMPEFDLEGTAGEFLQGQEFKEVLSKWEADVRSTRGDRGPLI